MGGAESEKKRTKNVRLMAESRIKKDRVLATMERTLRNYNPRPRQNTNCRRRRLRGRNTKQDHTLSR